MKSLVHRCKFKHRKLQKRNINRFNNIIINSFLVINNDLSYKYLKFLLKRNKIILNRKVLSDLFIFEKRFLASINNLFLFMNLVKII
jgi:ribosomal protein L20|uniref:50S ribosomal protein L20 n=1 Tax=Cyanidiaceae sp. MX-AZ01 TaxID=1503164 RepID=A0A060A4N5_9RHOD|nr:50S ribosomal protein L20 [Cyanidiaceae sp. MX-AZ01]